MKSDKAKIIYKYFGVAFERFRKVGVCEKGKVAPNKVGWPPPWDFDIDAAINDSDDQVDIISVFCHSYWTTWKVEYCYCLFALSIIVDQHNEGGMIHCQSYLHIPILSLPTHRPAPTFRPVTSSHTTNLVIFQAKYAFEHLDSDTAVSTGVTVLWQWTQNSSRSL